MYCPTARQHTAGRLGLKDKVDSFDCIVSEGGRGGGGEEEAQIGSFSLVRQLKPKGLKLIILTKNTNLFLFHVMI